MNSNIIATIFKLFSIMSARQKAWLAVLFFVVATSSLFQMITVGSIPLVVSALQSPEVVLEHRLYKEVSHYINLSALPLVDVAVMTLVGAFVSANLSSVLVLYLRSWIVKDFTIDLSERLFNYYISAPYTFHLGANTAHATRNLTSEVSTAVSNFSAIVTLTMSAMTITFIVALLVYQDPILTAFVLFAGTISAGLVFVMTRRVSSKTGRIVHLEQAHMLKVINHAFGGIRDIHILNRIGYFSGLFSKSVHKFCRAKLNQTVVSGVIQPLIQSAGLLALMLIVFFAYLSDGGLSELLPTISLFGAALHRMLPNLSELVSTAGKFYYGAAGTKAVVDDIVRFSQSGLNFQEDGNFANEGAPIEYRKTLELRNVKYTYPSADKASLVDISLECRRGEMIGLVGETGSGKSTIVDIILGLISPDSGTVLVDGIDVSNNRNRWMGGIGMVSQSVFLMDETVRENVTMGLPQDQIDDVKVWRALELAQIDGVVKNLPHGLDEIVGERGVRLSGGERQRIALARALYSNPSVLIMDEGTSALDNQTEKKLMDAVKSLRSNYTIIMIAHRLSSVVDCDRLYLIDAGKVSACGNYGALLVSSDKFNALASTYGA